MALTLPSARDRVWQFVLDALRQLDARLDRAATAVGLAAEIAARMAADAAHAAAAIATAHPSGSLPQSRTHASPDTDASATALHHTLGTGANQACAGNDSRLSDSRTPSGSAGGDLSGTYPNPTVAQARGLRETAGPTTLALGAIADGEFLKRSGTSIVGAAGGGTSDHAALSHLAYADAGHTGFAPASHSHAAADVTGTAVVKTDVPTPANPGDDGKPLKASSGVGTWGSIAQAQSHDSPDTDAASSSLHHTLGTGANQAAAGNHAHSGVYVPAAVLPAPADPGDDGKVLTAAGGVGAWATLVRGIAYFTAVVYGTTQLTVSTYLGALPFDSTDWATVTFAAIASADGACTGEVDLYDLTAATNVYTLTIPNGGTAMQSHAVTLTAATHVYEIRARRVGGSATDTLTVEWAGLIAQG